MRIIHIDQHAVDCIAEPLKLIRFPQECIGSGCSPATDSGPITVFGGYGKINSIATGRKYKEEDHENAIRRK
jgi:hypothetical protein